MIVGYARTSTSDQTAGLAAQERDLRAAGAERVFTEQVSSVAQRAAPGRVPGVPAAGRRADGHQARPPGAQHGRAAGDRGGPVQARHRPGRAQHGRRAAGHPQPDQQADADHPGRRGDVGARDHAGAPARGHRRGEGRGKYKGRPATIEPEDNRVLAATMGPAAIAKHLGIARSSVTACWRAAGLRPRATGRT